MTLSELADTLPNGFHDSQLASVCVSFLEGTATLDLAIDVSSEEEDGYFEDAEIRLTGLLAIVLDPPFSLEKCQGFIWIDACDTNEERYPGFSLIPQDIQPKFLSIYLGDHCNTFMHLAADSAEIEWKKGSRRLGSRRGGRG